jgi:ribosomal protein S18 acetylase RimI-like enzyme
MLFEILDSKWHNRKDFDCGVQELNLYLQQIANQDQKRGLSRTYVLADSASIVGYHSLAAHSVSRENLPPNVSAGGYKDIPFLLLGRLAVDRKFQGQGYGGAMIYHAFHITRETAEKVGIIGMIVDAKSEKAASFYEGFGFRRIQGSKNRLVMPISSLGDHVRAAHT